MSQNHGGRLARQTTSDKPGRPSLDRPSLFAGMDNEDSTFGGDTQRVRILSTLESARRPTGRKGPTKIQGITRQKRSNWQTKALLGLMGIGVLTLLISFVMVVVDGHAAPAKPESTNKPAAAAPEAKRVNGLAPKVAADTSNPLAALIAPPQHPAIAPAPTHAAVIENVNSAPPAASPLGRLAAQPAEPRPASASVHPSASPDTAKQVAVASQATNTAKQTATHTAPQMTANKSGQALAANHGTSTTEVAGDGLGATAKAVTPPAAKRSQASKSKDDDVALLEAMFAHTRPRPAATSVADELKQRCGGLNGADAATCRARVCVQNPTAAACHQD
ncbi:MAG: hypothetical protein EPO09_10910 [Aquabacterium sp.]|uniref:hypothetical protein n=1 Tax=Aquabacterium sp. TaxID=1872578 RepID=UPI00121EFB25|nr:hypothetical protein [Aquabacterium sp.]TAK93969.1 MAG: hypothetical protein EPO09_10910 [Aquabacterium sp.]